MGLLHNTFKLTKTQRKAVAVLAVILTLTSTRVQAAEQTSVLPDAPQWETGSVEQNDNIGHSLIVPDRYAGELKEAQSIRVMRVTVTAYASVPEETDSSPFTTADGSQVRDGIVAANFLKFGTRVRLPELFGDKVFEVHDRMNARYQDRVDIWMASAKEDRDFGIQRNVKIEIL